MGRARRDDVDLDEHLESAVDISEDIEDLKEDFRRLPADLAFHNSKYATAAREYQLAKFERERVEAELMNDSAFYEEVAEDLGKKPTVANLNAAIKLHDDYKEARHEEIDALYKKDSAAGRLDALRAKQSVLMSLGAFVREELRDPIVRRLHDDDES